MRACYDPEIPLNLVDLGVVVGVTVRVDAEAPGAGIVGVPERCRVAVRLLATSADEGVRAKMLGQVENLLRGMEGVSQVRLEVVEDEVWTPARISAAGRRVLGMDGVQFPILNNRVR